MPAGGSVQATGVKLGKSEDTELGANVGVEEAAGASDGISEGTDVALSLISSAFVENLGGTLSADSS
jgi:hypothetical protein